MECRKCGAPAAEGASFCGKCGARLDGKIPCKACGKLNLEEHEFCVYCGTRIDGKTVCATCGNAHEEKFCPYCGVAAKPEKSVPKRAGNTKTVADIIANAAMLLGAVLALIFVFFIGLKLQVEGADEETMGIFYYFGQYWQELKGLHIDQINTTPWFIDGIYYQLNAAGIVGIVLAVATLATTVTFTVIAIVKYSVGWAKGEHVNVEGWSLAAIISFLIGAVSIYAFNSAAVEGDVGELLGSGAGAATLIHFNDETVTAIVLLSICVVASVVFRMICEGKALWAKENLAKQTLTLISLVFAAVVLGISQGVNFAFIIETDEVYASVGGAFLQLGGGFTMGLATNFSNTSAKGYYDVTNAVGTMGSINVFATIFTIALTVFSGLALMENIRCASGKEDNSLLWSILALASAVITLILTIVSVSCVAEIFNIMQKISGVKQPENMIFGNFIAPILSIIFTVALFVLSLIKNKAANTVENA